MATSRPVSGHTGTRCWRPGTGWSSRARGTARNAMSGAPTPAGGSRRLATCGPTRSWRRLMTCRVSRSSQRLAASCPETGIRARGRPPARVPGADMRREGLRRSVRLVRLFRSEQADPEEYYAAIAEDAVAQVAGYCELSDRIVVDIGGGGGWFTPPFRGHGGPCCLRE